MIFILIYGNLLSAICIIQRCVSGVLRRIQDMPKTEQINWSRRCKLKWGICTLTSQN